MNNIENIVRGICVRENKILLAYIPKDDYYFLPGGHVEHSESIFTALEREMKEETGLQVKASELLIIFEHSWKKKENLIHEMNFIVGFEIIGDFEIASLVEHLKFVWLPIEDILNIKFLSKEIVNDVYKAAKGEKELKFVSSI